MSKLDHAVGRLSAALGSLERAVSDGGPARAADQVSAKTKALETERNQLAAEVARLERQVTEDAALRAEAADAVREALGELRAVAESEMETSDG